VLDLDLARVDDPAHHSNMTQPHPVPVLRTQSRTMLSRP
jgi:hypothetical protein